MLSERHYEYKARKYLDGTTLRIKHPEIYKKFDKFSLQKDR